MQKNTKNINPKNVQYAAVKNQDLLKIKKENGY